MYFRKFINLNIIFNSRVNIQTYAQFLFKIIFNIIFFFFWL